jgi:hypothetical protein
MIELINRTLTNTIISEVKKATAFLRQSEMETVAVGPDGISSSVRGPIANVIKMMERKVDDSQIEKYLNQKSSKAETELLMRKIQVMHSQLKQVSLLVTQKMKSSLDSTAGETAHSKVNKKTNMLNNAMLISNWI